MDLGLDDDQALRVRELQEIRDHALPALGLFLNDVVERLGSFLRFAQGRDRVEDDGDRISYLVGDHRRHFSERGESLLLHELFLSGAKLSSVLHESARELVRHRDHEHQVAEVEYVRHGQNARRDERVVDARDRERDQAEELTSRGGRARPLATHGARYEEHQRAHEEHESQVPTPIGLGVQIANAEPGDGVVGERGDVERARNEANGPERKPRHDHGLFVAEEAAAVPSRRVDEPRREVQRREEDGETNTEPRHPLRAYREPDHGHGVERTESRTRRERTTPSHARRVRDRIEQGREKQTHDAGGEREKGREVHVDCDARSSLAPHGRLAVRRLGARLDEGRTLVHSIGAHALPKRNDSRIVPP